MNGAVMCHVLCLTLSFIRSIHKLTLVQDGDTGPYSARVLVCELLVAVYAGWYEGRAEAAEGVRTIVPTFQQANMWTQYSPEVCLCWRIQD
ncbi:hypothetical protein BDW67DRAFT_152196 [Aspergillus spinulosporus]